MIRKKKKKIHKIKLKFVPNKLKVKLHKIQRINLNNYCRLIIFSNIKVT